MTITTVFKGVFIHQQTSQREAPATVCKYVYMYVRIYIYIYIFFFIYTYIYIYYEWQHPVAVKSKNCSKDIPIQKIDEGKLKTDNVATSGEKIGATRSAQRSRSTDPRSLLFQSLHQKLPTANALRGL